jgi:hypothetical protein
MTKTNKTKTRTQKIMHKQHNKTWNLLQTSGGKDEPNIVFMGKSLSTPQHGTKNVKTHNKTWNLLQTSGGKDEPNMLTTIFP